MKRKKYFKRLKFQIDSTNVKIINKKDKRKKEKDFSFKKNSKRKYMLLIDGKKRVQKWWGGYSPKVYDGNFLIINRSWFEIEKDRSCSKPTL